MEAVMTGLQTPMDTSVAGGMGEGLQVSKMEIQRAALGKVGSNLVSGLDDDGFKTAWNKKGSYGAFRGRGQVRGMRRSFSFDRGRGGRGFPRGGASGSSEPRGGRGIPEENVESHSKGRFDILALQQEMDLIEEPGVLVQSPFSNSRFLKMLPNGDFEDEVYEEEKDWEPDDEQDEMEKSELGYPLEKREAETEDPRDQIDDNMHKKGRFETSEATQLF